MAWIGPTAPLPTQNRAHSSPSLLYTYLLVAACTDREGLIWLLSHHCHCALSLAQAEEEQQPSSSHSGVQAGRTDSMGNHKWGWRFPGGTGTQEWQGGAYLSVLQSFDGLNVRLL